MAFAIAVCVGVLCLPYLDATFLTLRDSAAHTPDEGTILYDAARIARGHAPYREVFNFRGPYAFLPYVLAFKVGAANAHTGRIAQFVIMGLLSGVAYLFGLAVSRRRSLAAVVASWPLFVAWPAWPYAYLDFGAQLASVSAALALVLGHRRVDRTDYRWIAVAGGLAGVATWTSLAQGVTVLAALAGGLALQSVLAGQPRREALRRQAWYWGGFLAATLLAVAWLVRHGAVRAAIEDTLVFPFKYYRSGANTTTYAYDAEAYASVWAGRGLWLGRAARACLGGLEAAPALAMGVAVLWIGRLLIRRAGWRWASLPTPALAACALVAPAVPVLLSRTRSDVCHIGFIVVSVVFLLAALVGAARRSARRLVRAAGVGGILALAIPPLGGAVVYGYGLHARSEPGMPIDKEVQVTLGTDLYEARLGPGETFVATPYGGWYNLETGHDNATSFSLLYADPYCRGQWAIAAQQIAERQPALLAMSEPIFNLLATREPRLRQLYFGFSGNYLLDRAQPGPTLARKRWALSRVEADGSVSDTVAVDLKVDDHLPRLHADFGGGPQRAALYGKRFLLFASSTTYIGTLSDDGATIEGRIFSGAREVARFRAAAPSR